MPEKILFPSEDWMNAFVGLVDGSPEYQKAAGNWEGTIGLVIEEENGKLDKDLIFYADPYHGEIRDYCLINSLEEKDIDFVIRGPYSVWKEIQQGKLDSMQAIMKGKVQIKGNMAALLKQVKATQIMMKFLEQIPTKYVDEV